MTTKGNDIEGIKGGVVATVLLFNRRRRVQTSSPEDDTAAVLPTAHGADDTAVALSADLGEDLAFWQVLSNAKVASALDTEAFP